MTSIVYWRMTINEQKQIGEQRMKIDISKLVRWTDSDVYSRPHSFVFKVTHDLTSFSGDFSVSLDDIEDLETNLTDIIKQLQDYRLGQNHECQHESDGRNYGRLEWGGENEFKCKKCGAYYK